MPLQLKVAPKNVYDVPAAIICPQDGDDYIVSEFRVTFERFRYSDRKQFLTERAAIQANAAVRALKAISGLKGQDADAQAAMIAEYEKSVAQVADDFDFDADFAVRWMTKKVRGFPGLMALDGNGNDVPVTVSDIPDLMEDLSYRTGLMKLLEQQIQDPNGEEAKNSKSSDADGQADRTKP